VLLNPNVENPCTSTQPSCRIHHAARWQTQAWAGRTNKRANLALDVG
jgi:hypothetical protein